MDDSFWRKVEIAKNNKMMGAERMTESLRLFDEVTRRMQAGIKAQFPGISDEETHGTPQSDSILFAKSRHCHECRTSIHSRVIEILNHHNIPYMVVGSLSTNYHSIVRSTKDADIVIQANLGETARIIANELMTLSLTHRLVSRASR